MFDILILTAYLLSFPKCISKLFLHFFDLSLDLLDKTLFIIKLLLEFYACLFLKFKSVFDYR